MNKKLFIGSLAFLLGCGCLAASTCYQEHSFESIPIIHIENIPQDMRERFLKGELSNFILECPEGTRLPLALSVKGDVLSLEPLTPLVVSFARTVYIRFEKDQWYFSTDGCRWKGLLDFVTGNISVGLDAQKGYTEANLDIEANLRS